MNDFHHNDGHVMSTPGRKWSQGWSQSYPYLTRCSCRSAFSPAVCRDRPADRCPGGHGGALHPAPGRGAEGGAAGRPHRGRLCPREQDGEGLSVHPQRHRLHRLALHPLRDGGAGSQVLLCAKGVRKVELYGGGKEVLYVTTKHADVYMKIPEWRAGIILTNRPRYRPSFDCNLLYSNKICIPETWCNVWFYASFIKTGCMYHRQTALLAFTSCEQTLDRKERNHLRTTRVRV